MHCGYPHDVALLGPGSLCYLLFLLFLLLLSWFINNRVHYMQRAPKNVIKIHQSRFLLFSTLAFLIKTQLLNFGTDFSQSYFPLALLIFLLLEPLFSGDSWQQPQDSCCCTLRVSVFGHFLQNSANNFPKVVAAVFCCPQEEETKG